MIEILGCGYIAAFNDTFSIVVKTICYNLICLQLSSVADISEAPLSGEEVSLVALFGHLESLTELVTKQGSGVHAANTVWETFKDVLFDKTLKR